MLLGLTIRTLGTATAAAVVLASGLAVAQSTGADLLYRVRPVVAADRTELDVELAYRAEAPDTVRLPVDCYGSPDLHRSVASFVGVGGTKVAAGADPTRRSVTPGPDGRVRLRYRMSYDPVAMDDYAFSANTSPRHFHVGGCQWMLAVGDPAVSRLNAVEIVDPPAGWRFYSSWGPDGRRSQRSGVYDRVKVSALGGEKGFHRRFQVRSRPVDVFIADGLDLPEEQIAGSIEKIVTLQRERMDDFDYPFYTVALRPRSEVIAGTALGDSLFVVFVRRDASIEAVQELLAHEMFHNWLPNKARVVTASAPEQTRFEWLHEGVAEYMTRRLLLDAGLISREQFVALFNEDLVRIAHSPYRGATTADLAEALRDRRFTNLHKKLSYYRGALIALRWEDALRRADSGKQVIDLVKDMTRLAGDDHELSDDAFFSLARAYGLDARADFEKHLVRAEPIVPPPALDGYALTETVIPGFDIGFDVGLSLRRKRLAGVTTDGPAYRAGLRDGMELVKLDNTNPPLGGWPAAKPVTVRVKSDGVERTFEYAPVAPDIRVARYTKAAPAGGAP